MQRLRAGDIGSTEGIERRGDGVRADGGEIKPASVSHEVTVENTPDDSPKDTAQNQHDTRATFPSPETTKPLDQIDSSTQTQEEVQDNVKKVSAEGSRTAAAASGQVKTSLGAGQKVNSIVTTKSTDCQRNNLTTESPAQIPNQPKTDTDMAHGATASSSFEIKPSGIKAGKQEMPPGSWCQTQIPDVVAERLVGSDMVEDVETSGKLTTQVPAKVSSTSSKGQNKTVYVQEKKDLGHGASCGNPYFSSYTVSAAAAYDDLEQEEDDSAKMDSVIEQIEKQMAAVLEKIEGDMPSLLGHIRDGPEGLPKAKSAQSSPLVSHRSYQHHSTPPPLPTTPRPAIPSLPHLTIPPPSYPPPHPPTHIQSNDPPDTEQD